MPHYHKKPSSEWIGEVKTRLCLKCRKPFKSSWAGERICQHCKSLPSWRQATISTSEYEVIRRR